MTDDQRPRFYERSQRPETPEDARRQRSNTMVTLGVIAFLVGVLALNGGVTLGILFGILGVGLLVGGLVIR